MRVMVKTITLREANQAFSRVIREVEAGEEFTITRNGEPVARLVPARRERVLTPEQLAAVERTRRRMRRAGHCRRSTARNSTTRLSGGMMQIGVVKPRFTLDTNLLVYSVDQGEAVKHPLAAQIFWPPRISTAG